VRDVLSKAGYILLMLVVLVWLYIPVFTLTVYALHEDILFTLPLKPTFKWFGEIFTDPDVGRVLVYTLWTAVVTALVATCIAVPGALAYARYDFKGKSFYKRLILLPIFFPQLVLGIGILVFLHYLDILPSTTSMVLGECVILAPIATLVIAIAAFGYAPELEHAGRDLGGSVFHVFRTITFPLIAPGVFSGFLFAFILSWGNFYIDLFASSSQSTVPTWIYGHMMQGFNPLIPAVSVLSVFAPLLFFLVATPVLFKRMR
jgi:spermidine/putrescine transport system permease protein